MSLEVCSSFWNKDNYASNHCRMIFSRRLFKDHGFSLKRQRQRMFLLGIQENTINCYDYKNVGSLVVATPVPIIGVNYDNVFLLNVHCGFSSNLFFFSFVFLSKNMMNVGHSKWFKMKNNVCLGC